MGKGIAAIDFSHLLSFVTGVLPSWVESKCAERGGEKRRKRERDRCVFMRICISLALS